MHKAISVVLHFQNAALLFDAFFLSVPIDTGLEPETVLLAGACKNVVVHGIGHAYAPHQLYTIQDCTAPTRLW